MLLIFVLLACISPLLTFAALWQIKEWRIDRLREHFRASGWFRQLFGIARPIIVSATLLSGFIVEGIWILALLSIVQIVMQKQRYPVWTKKAVILVGISVLINLLLTELRITNYELRIFIPILQPLILYISWLLFLPLDSYMKNRIMKKATKLRSSYKNLTAIGITGSVGKTTTKELLAHILQEKNVLYTPAYVNSEMGVAQWLLQELPKYSPDDKLILIAEMGAYRPGEIARLCKIVQPKMGIITFIGTQHIALFGSQEQICNAKAELIESLPADGNAFLNADNELCSSTQDRCKGEVITVGTGGHADREAFDIEETAKGISFRLLDLKYTVPLRGTHNVTNVLLAIAVGQNLEMTHHELMSAVQTFQPPSSTFSVRSEHGVTMLDDTHNASPESFRAAIAWAKTQPMEKKILLTPGLIELGVKQDSIHRELGNAASGIFDRVIFTAKQGKNAFQSGYSKKVEMMNTSSEKITEGDLLVCVGRINQRTISALLPK